MTIHAHFDGKVIVPDEPLDLQPNQALVIRIEAGAATADEKAEYLALQSSLAHAKSGNPPTEERSEI